MTTSWHRWKRDAAGDIRLVTPTLCRLLGIDLPARSTPDVMTQVVDAAADLLGGQPIEKVLFFAPDAVGAFLWEEQHHLFSGVESHAPIAVKLLSVMPSKTPVCFTSMLTGMTPDEHGVRSMDRQTIKHDTLFDALIRAGKRIALASTYGGCMDYFWRGRDMDYFIEKSPPEVSRTALSLVEKAKYDVIVVYYSGYDGIIHRLHPQHPEALKVAADLMHDFDAMVHAFSTVWSDHNRLVLFAPDHGAHFDPELGTGAHGLDVPEDMNLLHFFGIGVR